LFAHRHEDAIKALEASQEKRFFGTKVSVSIHDGVGKNGLLYFIDPYTYRPDLC
jgi:hypothetical protein